MHNYLPTKAADYTAVTLSVAPQTVMTEEGHRNQAVHEFDDGSVGVVGISSQSYFNVTLQWDYLDAADSAAILDYWHNASKGAGMLRTFYWKHPIDGYEYTVRFMSNMRKKYQTGIMQGIESVTLRVEGVKP